MPIIILSEAKYRNLTEHLNGFFSSFFICWHCIFKIDKPEKTGNDRSDHNGYFGIINGDLIFKGEYGDKDGHGKPNSCQQTHARNVYPFQTFG